MIHTPNPDHQANQQAYRYGGTFKRPWGPVKKEKAK